MHGQEDLAIVWVLVMAIILFFLFWSTPANSNPIQVYEREIGRLEALKDFYPAATSVPRGIFKLGDKSEAVRMISERLKQDYPEVEITTDFTQELDIWVRKFQEDNGLFVDGIVGPQTRSALNFSIQDKIELVQEAIDYIEEQEFGDRYILVNIPAQELIAYNQGVGEIRSKTIVGKPEHRTPRIISNLYSIKYNPDWSVPPGITRRYVAKLNKDGPGYFRQKGIRIIRGESGIRFYQPPGANNALGRLKFELDNGYSIYLHDTNTKRLFDRPTRLFSSGCVRVEGYLELAAWILEENTDYVINNINSGRTYWEKVSNPVPVHMVYFQAWPDQFGGVNYYPDVYGING